MSARIPGWLDELDATLSDSAVLADRGRAAFDSDLALPLAFEALCNRVGDLCKKLVDADPALFGEPIWRQAVRNRNFVVHQYHGIDRDALWQTVTRSFAELSAEVARHRT